MRFLCSRAVSSDTRQVHTHTSAETRTGRSKILPLSTYKASGKAHGYLILGWKRYLPSYPQAGINDAGLCFDWAAVPPQRFTAVPGKPDASLDITIDLLKSCSTVEEALAYISGYNVSHFAEEHLMLADKSGDSCVVEYSGGKLHIIRNDAEYQFVTNFHLSDPSLGWYPCERYRKLETFFKEPGEKTGRLSEALDAVHQEGAYPTIYSYVFDLSAMRMTLYYNHDYTRAKTYSVPELLEKNGGFDIGI